MKVLIVDDSSFIILFCRQALEKSGFDVVGEAYDGCEAVELAEKLKPDVIIMDIAMPKKNGFEATENILAIHPKTKILAVSALDEDWIREKALQVGCFDFLAKPFEALQLIDRVQSLVEESGGLKYG